MKKRFTNVLLILVLFGCKNVKNEKNASVQINEKSENTFKIFSRNVGDSFYVSVSLPLNYTAGKKYPVIYILDANIYFDIIAPAIHKYSELGIAPEIILVGVGYKDFQLLDSLRNRDYTFPLADKEYDMTVSGGADKFLSFFTTELFPYIENKFQSDTTKRVIAGHSLGGYFTCYALLQSLNGNESGFYGFIAASPSLHYNKYYLLNQLRSQQPYENKINKLKVYITFGELEDEEDEDEPNLKKVNQMVNELQSALSHERFKSLDLNCTVMSNFSHMDTPIQTFIKGLQWIFPNE